MTTMAMSLIVHVDRNGVTFTVEEQSKRTCTIDIDMGVVFAAPELRECLFIKKVRFSPNLDSSRSIVSTAFKGPV